MWPPESLWKFVGETELVLYFILMDAIAVFTQCTLVQFFFQDYGGIVFEQKYKRTMLRAQFSWAKAQSKREMLATSKTTWTKLWFSWVLLAKCTGYTFNVLYLHFAYTHKSFDNKSPCFKHKFHNSDPVSHLSSAITSQLSAKKQIHSSA